MLLRDIKEGEIYAWIEGYGERTRQENIFCGNLPPARAMKVVKKEKRLVEVRRDSCGRPKMQNQTFLVCDLINVDPTDIMAGDLDIVEDKHPELVTPAEEIKAADLIWPWPMEVEQARTNAEILRQVDLRVAYVEGMSYRAARWMLEKELPTMRVLVKRIREAQKSHKRLDDSIQWATNPQIASLKQAVYSTLKEEGYPYRQAQAVKVYASVRLGSPHSNYSWSRPASGFDNVCYRRSFEVSVELFSRKFLYRSDVGGLLPSMTERNALVKKREAAEAEGESYELRQEMTDQLHILESKLTDEFKALPPETIVGFIDEQLNVLREKVEKEFGKRLPKFTQKGKNWVKWAEAEKEAAESLLNKS